MKKVLILTSTFPLNQESSANPCVKNMAKGLSKHHEITLLLPDHPKLKTTWIKNTSIERFRYFWPNKLQKLSYGSGILPTIRTNPLLAIQALSYIFFQTIATKRIVKQKNIDIILANWALPSGLSAVLSAKNKTICYIHGSDLAVNNPLYNTLLRFVILKSSFVLTVSKSLEKTIKCKFKIKNLKTINQGIEIPPKQNNYKKNRNIVYIGRLIRGKGVEQLIDTFKLNSIKKLNIKLKVIGNGPYKNTLVKRAGQSKKIIFIGAVAHKKVLNLIKKCKLLVFPSQLPEGLPNILLEAGASRVPILTTNTGGVSDLISADTGYFTSGKPKDIANKINKILNDDQAVQQKSNRLYKKIKKNFSIQINSKKIANIIDNI